MDDNNKKFFERILLGIALLFAASPMIREEGFWITVSVIGFLCFVAWVAREGWRNY